MLGGAETPTDVLRSDYHVDYRLQHDCVPLQVTLMTCMGWWIYHSLVSAAVAAAAKQHTKKYLVPRFTKIQVFYKPNIMGLGGW